MYSLAYGCMYISMLALNMLAHLYIRCPFSKNTSRSVSRCKPIYQTNPLRRGVTKVASQTAILVYAQQTDVFTEACTNIINAIRSGGVRGTRNSIANGGTNAYHAFARLPPGLIIQNHKLIIENAVLVQPLLPSSRNVIGRNMNWLDLGLVRI
ncbi:hypothetical protein F5X97DRAFT_272174 [Nemania serpens]|nr:hypothetical protein F5X97DRAFT_272174 [Nemania serpens]